jgi:hypothetical protein
MYEQIIHSRLGCNITIQSQDNYTILPHCTWVPAAAHTKPLKLANFRKTCSEAERADYNNITISLDFSTNVFTAIS